MTTQQTDTPIKFHEGDPFADLLDDAANARVEVRLIDLLAEDDALRSLRDDNGQSLADVAEGLGTTRSAVSQLESRPLRAVKIGTLSDYLEVLGLELVLGVQPKRGAEL